MNQQATTKWRTCEGCGRPTWVPDGRCSRCGHPVTSDSPPLAGQRAPSGTANPWANRGVGSRQVGLAATLVALGDAALYVGGIIWLSATAPVPVGSADLGRLLLLLGGALLLGALVPLRGLRWRLVLVLGVLAVQCLAVGACVVMSFS
jgi:hypothetical protein